MNEFATIVKNHRGDRSYRRFAREINKCLPQNMSITWMTFCNWETGKHEPDVSTVFTAWNFAAPDSEAKEFFRDLLVNTSPSMVQKVSPSGSGAGGLDELTRKSAGREEFINVIVRDRGQ